MWTVSYTCKDKNKLFNNKNDFCYRFIWQEVLQDILSHSVFHMRIILILMEA